MGKGYTNYMCKKPFHPGSKANIKRTWMAEQKTETDKKKQEDLKVQYEKEQELYHNRALLSKESKDKLGLNFMYEAPPGATKEHQVTHKEDNEPEYKFEWQRKYNAPREDFARGNAEIRDQPFGIQVRNVRCIKCHKWGHINTDKECPLFHKASDSLDASNGMTPMELMRRMKEEEGLALKQTILGHRIDPNMANQQMIPSEDEEEDVEMQFLKTLSKKQKEKLLKKLEKLEKKSMKNIKTEKKKKRKRRSSSSSDSDNYRRKKRADKSSSRRRQRHDSVEWTEKKSSSHSRNSVKVKSRRQESDSRNHRHKRMNESSSSRDRRRSRSPIRK
ncbi:Putative electron transfer flavoprotein subunit [Chamberlinius hualienensis]